MSTFSYTKASLRVRRPMRSLLEMCEVLISETIESLKAIDFTGIDVTKQNNTCI